MNSKRPTLCIIGALVGRNAGRVTSQGEILADLLAGTGYDVRAASFAASRWTRLVDIAVSLVRWRGGADVVIIQTYGGPSFVVEDLASTIAQVFGRTIVLHLHGGAMPQFFARHPRWTRRVLSRAKAIVAPSAYLVDAVAPYGFSATTIPNVIDLTKYPFRLRSPARPRLFWMRSFHPIYNPVMALRTLAALRKTHPDATLVMAGQDNGLLSTMDAEAKRLGIESGLRLAGFLDDEGKRREGDAADIFISTNHVDNTPVAVIEAAAMGLPVVSTNVGGLSKLIRDGDTGLLVADDDADAMAVAIRRIVDEPSLAHRLSANGRAMAESSAWTNVQPSWTRLFDGLSTPRLTRSA